MCIFLTWKTWLYKHQERMKKHVVVQGKINCQNISNNIKKFEKFIVALWSEVVL